MPVVLAAGWGVFLCGQQVADGYGATMEYRAAPVCAGWSRAGHGGDGAECVRRQGGTVAGRRTGERCTSSSTGGVDSGGGGTTCHTYYEVAVERPDGTAWLEVPSEMHDAARRGDRAEVRLWRGEIVELTTRGRTQPYAPSSQSGVLPWLALGCLAVATGAWATVSGRLSGLVAFPNFGWLLVAPGLGWLGSMALFGGHPVTWGFAIVWTGFAVFWVVSAWRDG